MTTDSAPATSVPAIAPEVKNEEVEQLRSENKKLKYRVTHLLRAIDEIEGA